MQVFVQVKVSNFYQLILELIVQSPSLFHRKKKYFRGNSDTLTEEGKHKSIRFSVDKNNSLKIRIPVTEKSRISENVMLCVESLVIGSLTNSLNTANPPIRVLPFNCPSSLKTKKVESHFFLSCF